MSVNKITNSDGEFDGMTLEYHGAPSGQYMIIKLYCDPLAEVLDWDGTYMQHYDTDWNSYYSFVMYTKSACSYISTDRYWFFMKEFKYVFATALLLAGVIVCMAGRLLIKYVTFGSAILTVICATDATLYLIGDGL